MDADNLTTAISATATDANGNTSEFPACVGYVNEVIFADGFEHG